MTPFKWDPFKDLASLQDRMNRMFSESLDRIREATAGEPDKPWSPPVDIYETPETFVLLVELPGVPREAVAVEVSDGVMVIKGERQMIEGVGEGNLHHLERQYGAFERTFNLPLNVQPDRISAAMKDGLLTISIAKTEGQGSRKVKVNVE